MRVGKFFSVLGNLVPRKRSEFFVVFFLDADQNISELVARLWMGCSLPRKNMVEGGGRSMSIL